MAHSPEKKAEAVAAIINGDSWKSVQDRFGVSKGTLSNWIAQAKTELKLNSPESSEITLSGSENKRKRFDDALINLAFSSIEFLQSWAEICRDKDWVQGNAADAKGLGETVLDRIDRLMAVIGPSGSSDQT